MPKDNLPHDAAYKEFFSNPDMVKSLFMEFVPKAFVHDFNFNSLELCKADHITPDLQERFDDIIWRLRWKDTWCYVYIILEFQSTQDYWMALRIAVYTGLLYQGLVKSSVIKIGDKLPPVFPLVIYNGKDPWKALLSLHKLTTTLHPDLSKFQLNQEYFLIDVHQISRYQMDNAKGIASYIFRLERARDIQSVLEIFNEIKLILKDKKFDFLRHSIETWFSKVLTEMKIIAPEMWAELKKDNAMLAEKFDEWKEDFIEEGIARGRIEGREEVMDAQKTTLLEILNQRFGEIPPAWKERIDNLSDPSVISQLTISVMSASSPEEYEKILFKKNHN